VEAHRRGSRRAADFPVAGFSHLREAAVSELPLTTVAGVNHEKGPHRRSHRPSSADHPGMISLRAGRQVLPATDFAVSSAGS
jgi:hypothetical protein